MEITDLEGTNRVYEILIVQNLIFYLCTSRNPNLVWPCFDHISRVLLFSLTGMFSTPNVDNFEGNW